MRKLTVSLDGPGSSGKSSVGSAAAGELGYRFCDTGLLYRALTWVALDRGADPESAHELVPLIASVELAPDAQGRLVRVEVERHDVTADVHTPDVDRAVSRVARHEQVRRALVPRQRAIAEGGGIIMAGRDIGTVVLPDADLKLYLDVSLEERTRRRADERDVTDAGEVAAIAAELRRRDGIDSSRSTAPLRKPDGALLIRSDGNTLDQTVAAVVAAIRAAASPGDGSHDAAR